MKCQSISYLTLKHLFSKMPAGAPPAYIIYCDKTEDEIERFEKEQLG